MATIYLAEIVIVSLSYRCLYRCGVTGPSAPWPGLSLYQGVVFMNCCVQVPNYCEVIHQVTKDVLYGGLLRT